MARKRPLRDAGTVVVLEHARRSSPTTRSATRTCASSRCGCRASTTGATAGPAALSGAVRPGRLHRLGPRAPQLEAVQRERRRARGAADARAARWARRSSCSRTASRRSAATSTSTRPRSAITPTTCSQRDHPVRRPRVPHARLARAPRLLRQVVGRLRRDHPRHEVRAALGRHRRTTRATRTSTSSTAPTGRTRSTSSASTASRRARPGAYAPPRDAAAERGLRRGPRRRARAPLPRRRLEEAEAQRRRSATRS